MLRKPTRRARAADDKNIIVRKVRWKHQTGHSGAWKVAYADFVTSMMALFIVLWIISAGDTELKAGVARYFRDPGVFESSKGLIPAVQPDDQFIAKPGMDALKGLQEELQRDLRQLEEYPLIEKQISIRLTADGLLIEMVDTDKQAFFDLSSAELKPILRRVLQVIVPRVKTLSK